MTAREMMVKSDEQLLELALAGDGVSFGELARRWQRRIYAFVCRYVGNAEEAKDLTQNTFTKAYSNLDRLSDPASFSAWMHKIALNECRMRHRSQSRSRQVALEEIADSDSLQIETRTPEAVFQNTEIGDLLREVVQALPEEQRTVILMKEYQGLKFHEIAEIESVPLSTVKSRMYLGLKTLRLLLEKRT